MSVTGRKKYRIGVDVGGTNTDAVLLDPSVQPSVSSAHGILAAYKTPTTPNVTYGIQTAIKRIFDSVGVPKDQVSCIVIGTTAFINAVVEQDARRLDKIAVLRLSKSFLRDVPPFPDYFPPALETICNGYLGYVDGGLAIDGSEEARLNEEQVRRHCDEIRQLGIKIVVVAGVFSPIDEVFGQEARVEEIIREVLPDVDIVCSHRVANIGFKERENASILNAAVLRHARRTVKGYVAALIALGLSCPLYLTQNDGTIVECSEAAEFPIRTFSSGATNSMRGAAYLAGSHTNQNTPTIVVDIGGTTTDVGVLEGTGFPRQAPAYVSVAGVTVNYSMPLIHSIGLGGGSIVRDVGGNVSVGPDSVGHHLEKRSYVFGGSILTTTDISVASGKSVLGSKESVQHLEPGILSSVQKRIKKLLETAIDVVKTSPEPLPVLMVGGGSVIAPLSIKGASVVERPPYHDVANAVGAAISKVGGTVDIVQNTSQQSEKDAISYAKQLAIDRAVQAGADATSVSIVSVESIPLQYVSNQVRTIVKATGDLNEIISVSLLADGIQPGELEAPTAEEPEKHVAQIDDGSEVDLGSYKPNIAIDGKSGLVEWHISEVDLRLLALGMYVLGCGGGGNPSSTEVLLRGHLRDGHKMRVIDASSLDSAANIYWGGHMGSPAVSVERLASTETVEAVRVLMDYLQEDSFDALMGLEIGGGNGLEPFLVGSSKYFNAPVIDADWMDKLKTAFPTYHQTTIVAHEPGQLVPCAIDSGDGRSVVMTRTSSDVDVDRILRASCTELGSRVGMAARPTTANRVQKYGVTNTCSLAWRIGRCIERARQSNTLSLVAEAIVDEVGGTEAARILYRGKITAVERRLHKGHSYGEVVITGSISEDNNDATRRKEADEKGGYLRIPFKNENIIAEHISAEGNQTLIATVPDLIAVLDAGTGRGLGVPEYKYGVQVIVLGITCSPRWTDVPLALELGGPRAFGFDLDYKPLGKFREPKSVIEEFQRK